MCQEKDFYITTAIAYPNGRPHLGHALEIIQGDALARFYKLLGKNVFFQTGTDEHGTKNWETAKKEGKNVLDFLDGNVKVFKELYKKLNINYDNFLRTSSKEKHYKGAQKLWNALFEQGDIYKKKYKGLYCVGCESFKTEKELVDGKCENHPTREIQEVEEENYFFRLSKYKNKVIEKIRSDEFKIVPESRKNESIAWLEGANDVSFSRVKSVLPWGIPVPNDQDHVMYVWCDALSNYITGIGYENDDELFKKLWPADIHIIGKDILRFHSAFWPAMLLAAKLPLPKELFVHGFLLSNGSKMGKSCGNVIDPFTQIERFGSDSFRFYILETMTLGGDGNFSEDLIVERINSEVVSNLANFCYRVLSFTNKNFNSLVEKVDLSLEQEINEKIKLIQNAFEERDFRRALEEIFGISAIGNKYFQEKAPWKLIKEDRSNAEEVIGTCVNLVKILSILIYPIMPDFSEKIQKQLSLDGLGWNKGDLSFNLINHKINGAKIILRKVELQKKEIQNQKEFPLNLKVAEIVEVIDHPEADKLYVLKVNLGNEIRQLVAGLKSHYAKEDLIGKKIVVVTNLAPARLRGVDSKAMLLAGMDKIDGEEIVKILAPRHSKIGQSIYFEGNSKVTSDIIKYEEFSKLKLNIRSGNIYLGDPKGKEILKSDCEVISVDLNKGKVY